MLLKEAVVWLTPWVEILIQEGMCTVQSYENFNLVKSTSSHLDAEELAGELLLLFFRVVAQQWHSVKLLCLQS